MIKRFVFFRFSFATFFSTSSQTAGWTIAFSLASLSLSVNTIAASFSRSSSPFSSRIFVPKHSTMSSKHFVQVLQYLCLSRSDSACNSYNLHVLTPLLCFVPVFSRMHIYFQRHIQRSCPFHLFLENRPDFFQLRSIRFDQKFVVNLQHKP